MIDGRPSAHDEALSELEAPLTPGDAFRIALPNFEGPLDLLLHLIREHKLDIFDIPIALVTEKYLAHLKTMREINLDIAGEFLVMASTLAHIKSRLLLPRQEAVGEAEPEDQGDPRAELVRRLLEYQKYRDAAETLHRQDLLDRDVFARKVSVDKLPIPDDEIGLAELSVYKLIEALDRVLKALEPQDRYEVVRERISISDAIHTLVERLKLQGPVSFYSLFVGQRTRQQVITTFLAILEMCKLKLIRVSQEEGQDDIVVSARGEALSNMTATEVGDDYK
ncbi:MAG: segregation and condensation protein A [Myxococcaceae bacterium]